MKAGVDLRITLKTEEKQSCKNVFFLFLLSWNFPGTQMIKMTISLNQNKVFLVFLILLWIRSVQKMIKMYLSLHLASEISEMLETHAHKKFNFQKYRKIKILVFWSMQRNVVFKVNHELKCLKNFLT